MRWPLGVLFLAAACTTGGGTSSSSSSGVSGSSSSSSGSSGTRDAGLSSRDAGPGDAGLPITSSLLTGHVLAPSGSFGIFDALLSIQAADGDGGFSEVRTAHTRFDGLYQVHGLPPGDYRLRATRGNFSAVTTTRIDQPLSQVTGVDLRLDPSTARFVVVTGMYDRIEDIVGTGGAGGLGFHPTLVEGEWDSSWLATVANDAYLANVDVLFLNCGINDNIWEDPALETRRQALRNFVLGGKSLYTSDWAYNIFEWLFPEALTFYGDDGVRSSAKAGETEDVQVNITDELLVKIVGRTAVVTYDLSDWVVVDSVSAPDGGQDPDGGVFKVDVIARGAVHVQGMLESLPNRPLAIKLTAGQGRAIYTTFHNEAQLDPAIQAILQYFVLSL